MSTLPSLVDAFVQKINMQPRSPEVVEEVPAFLRRYALDARVTELSSRFTDWHIVKRDNSSRIDNLQNRMGRTFPPSFHYFLANYSFPAFESDGLMFFANTGDDTYWELEKRLFRDPHMSPQLLSAGFLQLGNPQFYDYDPVCFDCNGPGPETRIVQLDHEAILIDGEMRLVREIAPSFVDFIQAALR